MTKHRKEKKKRRKDYAFWRQLNEKPSIDAAHCYSSWAACMREGTFGTSLGCPGLEEKLCQHHQQWHIHRTCLTMQLGTISWRGSTQESAWFHCYHSWDDSSITMVTVTVGAWQCSLEQSSAGAAHKKWVFPLLAFLTWSKQYSCNRNRKGRVMRNNNSNNGDLRTMHSAAVYLPPDKLSI